MRLPIYQIDAFTSRIFAGNPAAVVPLESWLPDARMQAIAAENNLSETACFVADGAGWGLRWLGRTKLLACEDRGPRVGISGRAALYMEGAIYV